MLAFASGVLHRKAHAIGVREGLRLSAFYVAVGPSFSFAVTLALLAGGAAVALRKTRTETSGTSVPVTTGPAWGPKENET